MKVAILLALFAMVAVSAACTGFALFAMVAVSAAYYPDNYYGLYGYPWHAPAAYHGWPYAYTVAAGYPYHFNHGYGGIIGLHYNKATADQVASAEPAEPAAAAAAPAPQ